MKPFDLEKALNGAPVVTRDGHKVLQIHYEGRVICGLPVTAFIEEVGWRSFKEYGKYYDCGDSSLDLFMAYVKKEAWINIYGFNGVAKNTEKDIYKTKEEAENSGKIWDNYMTTVKIEWEE